ncbi:MAG: MBL fold metallo-hydrolase [Patescibacteria group bacterium]|nr:MBL fold metallo-hydrolase [Patescibacteria group bacterium]MDE2438710.1 MBL fold metallo-hydrolase [Patescibacteria group bacterium]
MKIKKIGHCCLLIKLDKMTILTDPGAFSTAQNEEMDIDVVLITHEHADHLHIESLKQVVLNNPKVKVITNSGVGAKLKDAGISYELLEGTKSTKVGNVFIEAFDGKHEEIFENVGQVQNTGYFIGGKLFYPGDSFYNPSKPVDILALPVAGPWCKIPDAIRYALAIKPKKAFPVHDGMLQKERIGGSHKIPNQILSENNIEFITMNEGDEKEF